MKRRRGESFALKNDWGASSSVQRLSFRRRMRSSSGFGFSGEDSFRRQGDDMPCHSTKGDSIINSVGRDAVLHSEARRIIKRRDARRRRSMISSTIAVIGFASIFGAACDTIPSATATLARNDIPIARSRHLRSLQALFQQCKIALAVGDIDRDNLLSKSEYLRFVNQFGSKIWDGPDGDYVEVSDFDKLPQSLRNNFDSFSDPTIGRIDISGAKPGQVVTSTQDSQLTNLCDSTALKILDIESNDPVHPEQPGPNNPGTDCNQIVDRGRCNVDLSISDTTQNNLLDESDYVKFVNRLSSNKYSNTQFGRLPLNIKENYYRFAVKDGQIDVSGSRPGQRVSVEQDIFLNVFCCETELAVENPAGSVDPGPGPGTSAPTFDLFFCQRSMASSDLNRDDGLSSDEYVIFLNRLTNNRFVGRTYDSLDVDLQANFVKLAGNHGKIDIFGSKPGQTSNFENENDLVNVCVETGNALDSSPADVSTPSPVSVVQPTISPTFRPNPAPTSPPTYTPGRSEVFNSFIISNTNGLTALELNAGTPIRESLDEAYAIFVQNAVDSYVALSENVEIRALRRRKLIVGLLPESDQIYSIVNSNCPTGSTLAEKCQTAFASFQLTLEDENAQEVSDSYSDYTQKLIAQGELQIGLEQVNGNSLLRIVDASYPVTPPVAEPTNMPTAAPNENEVKKKRNVAGPVVGSIFAILLVGLIAYVYFKGLPFELPFEFKVPFELPSFPKRGSARVGNDANNEDEVGLRLQDDDDASIGEKNGFGKEFGLDNRNSLGRGDEDDGQKDKNLFGFSTRKKNYEEDANDGLDSNQNSNSDQKESSNDMYAFDEPSEIESETDNQDDQPSTTDNEDIVFGEKPGSANWGSENVFESESSNQGWGANGGEENFFGTSAFGKGLEEEQEISESESEEESESYSSEDDTYDSGDVEESTQDMPSSGPDSGTYEEMEQQDSFSGSSSADEESYNSSSVPSVEMPSDLKLKNDDMDAAIDNGDWDAVVEAAKAFEKSDADSSLAGSLKRADQDINDESYSESYTDDDVSGTTATTTSEDRRKRAEYRTQVEELVKIVLPDETEKVDAMMDQFRGREAELISTLQTMEERSSNQRARAAIHKSKPPPQKNSGSYHGNNSNSQHGGEGSTAGTAAIAAASLPIPAEGSFGDSQTDEFGGSFGESNVFGDDDEEYDEGEGSDYGDESYYSEEDSQVSGSFYSEEEEESASRSYYTDEEDSGSQARSFYSQDPDASPGSGSGERSFYNEEEGESMAESYYSGDKEGQDQSYYSEEEEGSSYVSGEGGSFYSEGEEESPDDEQ